MADPMISRLINQFPLYQDPGRVKEDIANVTRHVRTLFPRRGTLTLNGGQSRDLIKVEGTVATFYRGTQYNTPVEIFITENYPSSPPMCYIRPTPGMSLKVGHRHVDQSGLVYLPYLHEWAGMTHNLVELCAHMSSVFGAEPPLFTTPRPAPTPPARPSTQQLQPPQPYIVPQNAKPVPDVPPRPRPEDVRREKMQAVTIKLQAELQTMYNQLRVEMDTAFETQAKLEEGREEVDADIEELTRRQNELVRLVEVSQDRCLELETYLEERKKEGEPEVDELIEPKDKLSEQMLGLVAENAALEDCLYYLDQGVTEGAITVEDFLSQVRKLARKQFVARATMKKVERAQQARNAARAAFNAQQAQNRGAGAYPRLPPQETGPPAYSRIGGPPPYTPSAGYAAPRTSYGQGFAPGLPAAGTSGSWRGSIRVGGAATPGSAFPYAGYNGGFGAGAAEEAMGGNGNQASSTQRR